MWQPRLAIRSLALTWVLALLACSGPAAQQVAAPSAFAARIAELSEPGGNFDTDNLVSNEASYLHAVSRLRALNVAGGAYLGVGPDQNFSYIAAIRPEIAFIIDLRRDNLLLQLIFKSLFELAATRVEYLSLLFGTPAPAGANGWADATIDRILAYIDTVPPAPGTAARARQRVDSALASFGVPLTDGDWMTIDRFHRTFIREKLGLRFHTTGRPPRFYYPTYRELILERDLAGRRVGYLASEEHFRSVKALQELDLVIPVVGDLAGDHALRAIARQLSARGLRVSAFYTSNVEFYLFRGGSFSRFVDNVTLLPVDGRSVLIRSVFRGLFGAAHPQAVPGYASTQIVQTIESLLRRQATGGYASYWDLVTRDILDPR